MDNQFKVGDVVILKSGGPKMTVVSVEAENELRCTWFVNGEIKEDFFILDILKKTEESDE
ncbi:YodC family protein [Legionella brunensis]|uniref:DUF2158 domain-containing protein n=1 Tax=Legionella brunensis TaxID=29422 RepID=A0A0W0SF28_9GAMM|nr:DUF2158 domain-containing protein [Legionella brunensis]KTC81761.1 hypothetical protein Lbru_1751 [Legionella brunensis]